MIEGPQSYPTDAWAQTSSHHQDKEQSYRHSQQQRRRDFEDWDYPRYQEDRGDYR